MTYILISSLEMGSAPKCSPSPKPCPVGQHAKPANPTPNWTLLWLRLGQNVVVENSFSSLRQNVNNMIQVTLTNIPAHKE
jgi:hypothetical protein